MMQSLFLVQDYLFCLIRNILEHFSYMYNVSNRCYIYFRDFYPILIIWLQGDKNQFLSKRMDLYFLYHNTLIPTYGRTQFLWLLQPLHLWGFLFERTTFNEYMI